MPPLPTPVGRTSIKPLSTARGPTTAGQCRRQPAAERGGTASLRPQPADLPPVWHSIRVGRWRPEGVWLDGRTWKGETQVSEYACLKKRSQLTASSAS